MRLDEIFASVVSVHPSEQRFKKSNFGQLWRLFVIKLFFFVITLYFFALRMHFLSFLTS
jgi:hypothetical protein